MQISASTLLASQQVGHVQAKPAPGFTQALQNASAFQPLSLKQASTSMEAAPAPSNFMEAAQKSQQKLGSMIDIKV